MVDYTKIELIGVSIALLKQSGYLNFTIDVNPDTGETGRKNYEVAYYMNLEFRIYESGRVFLMGSLHKYWNKGKHNFNDFSLKALLEVLQDLEIKLGITPDKMLIKQLEIGLNFNPPHPTRQILKYSFLSGSTPYKWVSVRDEGRYKQAEFQQYFNKLYDKKHHYEKQGFDVGKDDILRWEIKYRKLARLNKFGVKTIQDVINNLDLLLKELVNEWDKVLLYDFTIESKSKLLDKYSNPIFWEDITSNQPLFKKHKRQLKELIKNNSQQVSDSIKTALLKKGQELIKGIRFNQDCKEQSNTRGIRFNSLCIGLNEIPQHKPDAEIIYRCKITGYEKKVSKENGLYITPLDIAFYYEHDKTIYNDLIEKYSTTSYKNRNYDSMPLKERWVQMAKRIRSRKYNPKNNDANNLKFGTKRKIERVINEPTLTLWDNIKLIDTKYKRIANYY